MSISLIIVLLLVGLLLLLLEDQRANSYMNIVKKLTDLARLEKGWDGYEAPPIDKRVLLNAADIIKKLKTGIGDWELFPTLRGTVQFERSCNKKKYVEIEIYPEKYVVFTMERENSIEAHLTDMDAVVHIMRTEGKGYWRRFRYWFPKR